MTYHKERKDVSDKEKWDLTHIFPDLAAWEEKYQETIGKIKKLSTYDGKITTSKELLDYLTLSQNVSFTYGHLYIYAMLLLDLDTRNTDAQALLEKADYLGTDFSNATAFFSPFLLSLDENVLRRYINEENGLKYFEDDLLDAFRYKKHILSKEQEEVISKLSDALSSPEHTFSMINDADIVFGEVTSEKGEKVELTVGMFSKLIEDEKRDVRKEAYMAYYKPYVQLKNTIASTLSNTIKNNVTMSKVRNYPSALEKGLFRDNVPKKVYENLIVTTRNNLSSVKKYNLLRKEKLQVDELRAYDLSVPLVSGMKKDIPYEEAYETMLKGLLPLGEEYINLLKEFKNKNMIDVRETKGKRSGAYNIGIHGVHPYVLLNHHDDLDSVFTLAHELGHAAHSYYSSKHQPYNKSHYSIFVAEVASTVNEVLLIRYLIENTEDKKMKAYLLNHFIDQFKGTFFTQVMFSEFEKRTHEIAEKNETLNVEVFNSIYEELMSDYAGGVLTLDPQVKHGWSRIPHFYRPFYVYKYATGYASAIDIADRLLKGEKGALENYLNFLKSGDSDYPLELLRKTGVDLEQPGPIENALKVFDDLVLQLEDSL